MARSKKQGKDTNQGAGIGGATTAGTSAGMAMGASVDIAKSGIKPKGATAKNTGALAVKKRATKPGQAAIREIKK